MVVNCTGIGARDLCNDHTIFPTRGQVLKVGKFDLHQILA